MHSAQQPCGLQIRRSPHECLSGCCSILQAAAIALAGLSKRIATARAELDVARSRRRAVEVLRERRYEEWKLQEERREVAVIDELATCTAARRDPES